MLPFTLQKSRLAVASLDKHDLRAGPPLPAGNAVKRMRVPVVIERTGLGPAVVQVTCRATEIAEFSCVN